MRAFGPLVVGIVIRATAVASSPGAKAPGPRKSPRPWLVVCAIALMAAGGGCTRRSEQVAPGPPPSKPPASLPPAAAAGPSPPVVTAATATDPDAAAELIVGNDRALAAWRRDGAGKRIISKGPARLPRWIDERTVLVVRARSGGTDLAGGGRLEKVSLADGKRTRLATIPPFACRSPARGVPDGGTAAGHADDGFVPDESPTPLSVQDPNDFVMEDDGIACLDLIDRNINMASVSVTVRVGLETGKIMRTLTLGADECAPPPDVEIGSADSSPCVARQGEGPPPAGAAFPYGFDDERQFVTRRTPDGSTMPTAELRAYQADIGSPSGRWLVLGGEQEDGDYIHRKLVLLDRATGDVFPIPSKSTARWPAPLAPTGKRSPPRIRTPVAATAAVVGETDLRWLGRSAASEILIVDDLVVRPGVGAFSVKGDVAR